MKKAAKPRGRPPEQGEKAMKQIAVRLPVELLDRAEKIVEDRYGQPDRSDILREALAAGLDVLEGRKRK